MQQHSIEVKTWREKNPEKVKAHMAINNAIRYGKMVKGVCIVCGSTKVEAHHEDYSKPLNVIWVCRLHHSELHRKTQANFSSLITVDGVKRRQASTYVQKEKEAKMLKLKGFNYKQIGEKLKISKAQAYKIINKPKYS